MLKLKRNAAVLLVIAGIITTVLLPTAAFGQGADTQSPVAGAALQEAGTYTVITTPTYAHPLTGAIEDKGQNAAIGQGMTESMVDKTALLEVYEKGENYVTIRCNLMDNVSAVQLAYQLDADSEYIAVPHTVMQSTEDGTTADLRLALPNSTVIVKATMSIIPMGRDIVFFMTFDSPTLGSADFIVTELPAEKDAGAAQSSVAQTISAVPTATTQPPNQGAEAVSAPASDNGATGSTASAGEIALFAVATIATIAVIALSGFLIYKKRAGNARSQ